MFAYRSVSIETYQNLLKTAIKLTESLHATAMDVGDGKATIGFGYMSRPAWLHTRLVNSSGAFCVPLF